MGIDQQGVAPFRIGIVPRQMDLADRLRSQGIQIGRCAAPDVVDADIHIVDVQQQAAARRRSQFIEKGRLVHLVPIQGQIQGGIFDQQSASQGVLGAADVVRHLGQQSAGAWKRQKVWMVDAGPPGPGQMFGHRERFITVRQCSQTRQVAEVGRLIGSERQAHPVERQRLVPPDGLQPGQPGAALDHVVLGMDLEPQTGRRTGEGLFVVLGLQAQARRRPEGVG